MVTVIGTISSLNLPAAWAAAALSWLRTPYSSCAVLAELVALGHLLGGLQHVPVDLRLGIFSRPGR
jgi:hypothetical protein